LTRGSNDSAKSERAVDEELARLREKLWRVRGRRSRVTGVAFLVLSGFFLLLAYVTRYIVFEVISILALLLGVVFVFVGVESYVKLEVANRAVVSSLVPLASLLNHLKVEGKAIYIPPAPEQRLGKMFFQRQSVDSLPTFKEILKEDSLSVLDKGVLMPSIGSALLQLYEDELGDLRKLDLEYLLAWLPRVMTDGLQIADKVEITCNGNDFHLKMTNLAFRKVCQHPAAKVVCDAAGCPVCSSIAGAVSKNTGRIVYYLKCENDLVKRETDAFYKFGPSLEELRQRERVTETSGNLG